MMLSKLFLTLKFLQKNSRPIMAIFTIGVFMDQFLFQSLKRLKLELQELLGLLSEEELAKNYKLTLCYLNLHKSLIRL